MELTFALLQSVTKIVWVKVIYLLSSKRNSVLYHGHYWGLLSLEIPSSAFISCMLVPY